MGKNEGEGKEGEGGEVVGEAGVEVKGNVAEEEADAIGFADDAQECERAPKRIGEGGCGAFDEPGIKFGDGFVAISAKGSEQGKGTFGRQRHEYTRSDPVGGRGRGLVVRGGEVCGRGGERAPLGVNGQEEAIAKGSRRAFGGIHPGAAQEEEDTAL